MKVRKGFVSNSSSSSFICNYCGCIEAGYDMSLSDFDMLQCEEGHEFHIEHMEEGIEEIPLQIKKLYMLNYYEQELKSDTEYKQKYENKKDGKIELAEYEQNSLKRDPNYFIDKIKYYEEEIEKDKHNIESIQQITEETWDEFEDTYTDIINDRGIPKEYCPVCNRRKEMEKDPEYNKYSELYIKFKGVLPNGSKY